MSDEPEDISDLVAGGAACCVCATRNAHSWRRAQDNLLGTSAFYTAVRCDFCGTARLYPRPSPEEMALHYTPLTYARAEGQDQASGLGRRLNAIFARQADRFLEAAPSRGGRILDVGCGDGRFLSEMVHRGWSGEGIETDPIAAELARQRAGVPIWETTLESAVFEPGSFDAVSFLHVLEHVSDPRAVLRSARTVLRGGGTLLIAVPNVASFEASLFGSSWYHLDLPRHFWGFTPSSLRWLVNESLFRVTSIRYLPFLFAPQSIRNVLRGLRPGHRAGEGDAAPMARTRATEGRLQTELFLRLLSASEYWGRYIPGEIMEITAVAISAEEALSR